MAESLISIAEDVLRYFQDHVAASLLIALVAGFAGVKTVAWGKQTSLALVFIFGVLGWIMGQFAILGFGLEKILNEVSEFDFLFDFLAAYVGSFALASLLHFLKPL